MKKTIMLAIILFAITVSLIMCYKKITNTSLTKTLHLTTVYFNKGVYRTDSPDDKNPYKNYFYVFNDEKSGHTEDNKLGIGLPFSCIQKIGYVKFKFGGISEPEEIFKIKSVENGTIQGYFKDGSLLIFIPVLNANPDNFDAIEYIKKEEISTRILYP